MKTPLRAILALSIASPLFAGCLFTPPEEEGTTSGAYATSGGYGGDPNADMQQYESTQKELESHRTQLTDNGATEAVGAGTKIFWLEFPGFAPTVHSFDTTSNAQIDYGFGIGSDAYNFRVSRSFVVSAENTGDSVVFHVFDAKQANHSLGDITAPAPSDEQRWWAYAADDTRVYWIDTSNGAHVFAWTPGEAEANDILALEDLGVTTEIDDFGVDHGALVLITGGSVVRIDLATKTGKFLGNSTEAYGCDFDALGVLMDTADGPLFYRLADGTTTDVAQAIAGSDYQLNATYTGLQDFDTDFSRNGSIVGYIGGGGFFTFDLDSSEAKPVLLDALDASVTYRYPVLLEDGSMFVTGLLSDDGAIGADGPIYRIQ